MVGAVGERSAHRGKISFLHRSTHTVAILQIATDGLNSAVDQENTVVGLRRIKRGVAPIFIEESLDKTCILWRLESRAPKTGSQRAEHRFHVCLLQFWQ